MVTVNPPPNTAPISTVANQTVTTGQSTGAIAITVGDAETPVGSLTVTGSSSNTSLVASSGIVFGGSGANRTATITPVSGQTGTTTITLTVTDGGGLTATSTFVVTVNPPPNTAPTISTVANQTVNDGSIDECGSAITVGDAQKGSCGFADGDGFVVEHESGGVERHRVWWFER